MDKDLRNRLYEELNDVIQRYADCGATIQELKEDFKQSIDASGYNDI